MIYFGFGAHLNREFPGLTVEDVLTFLDAWKMRCTRNRVSMCHGGWDELGELGYTRYTPFFGQHPAYFWKTWTWIMHRTCDLVEGHYMMGTYGIPYTKRRVEFPLGCGNLGAKLLADGFNSA